MNPEDGFLANLARSPEDIATRLAYADWLEDRGDPRAAYLRLRCELLDQREANARRDLEAGSLKLAQGIDLEWWRFIELQDSLCRVSRRCGGPLPAALAVLWREQIWQRDPRHPERFGHGAQPDGPYFEIGLDMDGDMPDESIFNRDPERRKPFEPMLQQLDFLGCVNDQGDLFAFWKYDPEIRPMQAPIVSVSIGLSFSLGGRTVQDFFAIGDHSWLRNSMQWGWNEEQRDEFERARRWWSERGIETSTSLEALAEALTDFPDPQERFEQLIGTHPR